MCRRTQPLSERVVSRFLSVAIVLVLTALAGARLVAVEAGREESRGGLVGWARLATPQAQWGRHRDQDPQLARFIGAETSLNIEVWSSVGPDNIDRLCVFPFIFAKDLVGLTDPRHIENIAEYLRRGGFVCIDPCVNGYSTAQKENLVRQYGLFFKKLLPDSQLQEFPDDHPIYRCYFSVTLDDLYTPDMLRRGAIKPSHIGIHGVFLHERLIAVISTTGLECGWPETPQRAPGCMKLIVNSYIYAMIR